MRIYDFLESVECVYYIYIHICLKYMHLHAELGYRVDLTFIHYTVYRHGIHACRVSLSKFFLLSRFEFETIAWNRKFMKGCAY